MLARYLIMVIYAFIIVIATAMTNKNPDRNTLKDLAEPTDSHSSILRHLAGKKEENPGIVDLVPDEYSLMPP